MFKDEWTKIAMSNGYPELLNKADYITDTPIQNGIQKACLKYGLIKQKKYNNIFLLFIFIS